MYVTKGEPGVNDQILNACIDIPTNSGGDGYIAGLCLHLLTASLNTGLSEEGSPLGMYMSSIDRSLLIKTAATLRNTNHVVGGFSGGAITVFCRNPSLDISDLANTYSTAFNAGVLTPVKHLTNIVNSRFFLEDSKTDSTPLKKLSENYVNELKASKEYLAVKSLVKNKNSSISSIRDLTL